MAYTAGTVIGVIIGGILPIAILAAIIEFFAFKQQPPANRAANTVGLAWLIVAVLAGFAFGGEDGFAPFVGLAYLPGAALIWVWYRRRYAKAWVDDEE